jgi:cytoskeletal protein RodZ
MGNFGEDLRTERLNRGVALEDITAVTKISQRHLIALEQERFRLLPGGILSKGIVRGYVGALGLDPQDWTERFIKAYNDSGQMLEDDRGWTAFASNVGKSRILRREAAIMRLRWAGAILFLLAVVAGGYLLRHARRLVDKSGAERASLRGLAHRMVLAQHAGL